MLRTAHIAPALVVVFALGCLVSPVAAASDAGSPSAPLSQERQDDGRGTAKAEAPAGSPAIPPDGGAAAGESRIESLAPEAPAPAAEPESATPEQASYPGVLNARIERGGNGAPAINLCYPVFGVPAVDDNIRQWAESVVKSYETEVLKSVPEGEEKPGSYGMWELTGLFTLERPSPRVVSLTFNIYSYSGGAHGNLIIECRNYDLENGRQLDFADLFKDPEKALQLMADYSLASLTKSLGDESDDEMIREGTAPDLRNFANLTLMPGILGIEFQPYQVGPWSIGPQRVDMPLRDLAAAGPEPSVWGAVADAGASMTAPAPPKGDKARTDTTARKPDAADTANSAASDAQGGRKAAPDDDAAPAAPREATTSGAFKPTDIPSRAARTDAPGSVSKP